MGAGNLGQRIADNVRAASGAGAAAIYRRESGSGELSLHAASGPGAVALASALQSAGLGIVELTLRQGRSFLTADLASDPRIPLDPAVRQRVASSEHRAVFWAPLAMDDAAIGVLALGYPAGSSLEAQLPALEALAGHAAIAMYGAALCDEAYRRQQETAALEDVTREIVSSLDGNEVFRRIVHRARELGRSDLAILTTTEDGRAEAAVTAASGMSGEALATLTVRAGRGAGLRVLETGDPFVTDDVTRDTRLAGGPSDLPDELGAVALAVVPVRFHTSITGLLWVANKSRRRFTTEDVRVLGRLADQAAVALEHGRLYAEAQELAVSRERMRVATELHDALSQMLFSMALGLEWCLHRAGGQPELRSKIHEIKRETGVMMRQLRELIYHLVPGHAGDGDNTDKLRRLVAQFREFTGIPVELVEHGQSSALTPRHQDALYKTFQEALANVAKHARATRARISIEIGPGDVAFEVTDDGVGPPPHADLVRMARVPGHFGLRQMLERIDALGGAVAFGRAHPAGFRLWGMLPLDLR